MPHADDVGPLPAWDPEWEPIVAGYPDFSDYESAMPTLIAARRLTLTPEQVQRDGAFRLTHHTVPSRDGRTLELHVLTPTSGPVRGAIYWLHSGGMVSGAALAYDIAPVLGHAARHSLVVVAVEYALGPEHPPPAGVEDGFEGLVWTLAHHADLGYPESRLIVHGLSGGGGIAAGVALLAREAGLSYLGLLLDGPMLDDRMTTVSYRQHRASGRTMAASAATMWAGLLRDASPTLVSDAPHAIPGRLVDTDLSGLPPAFLMCGANDAFRDEVTAFAEAIWRSGGTADLHQWGGCPHGADSIAPHTHVSTESAAARDGWYDRMLAPVDAPAGTGLLEQLVAQIVERR